VNVKKILGFIGLYLVVIMFLNLW